MTDNEGKTITLYASEKEIEPDLYELPPQPPSGIFDARYSSGKFVEDLNEKKVIQFNSDKYPVTIKAEGLSLLIKDRKNGKILSKELNDGEAIKITDNKIRSIEVTGKITGELPVSYQLYQNYPNPFNPNTIIKFTLPKGSNVNLTIYNVLGELISTVVNKQMKPGDYQYSFDASRLVSGVYFFRLEAGNFIDTKKMIFLK